MHLPALWAGGEGTGVPSRGSTPPHTLLDHLPECGHLVQRHAAHERHGLAVRHHHQAICSGTRLSSWLYPAAAAARGWVAGAGAGLLLWALQVWGRRARLSALPTPAVGAGLPPGLPSGLASRATSLLRATPHEMVSPRRSLAAPRSAAASCTPRRRSGASAAHCAPAAGATASCWG